MTLAGLAGAALLLGLGLTLRSTGTRNGPPGSIAVGARDAGATAVTVERQPAPPVQAPPPAGSLFIRTNATTASWTLDGLLVGKSGGQIALHGIPPGAHRVAVATEGFKLREEVVEVAAEGAVSLVWELRPVRSERPRRPRRAPVDVDGLGGWPRRPGGDDADGDEAVPAPAPGGAPTRAAGGAETGPR